MPASDIVIKGAREHNLQNVDVTIPRNQLVCLTGVSGSGKSSLAFDTLFAEGQRRYIESLSTFARQFLGNMPKPDCDHLSGLSPSISISQKSSGNNPRSTVGTITEIYDFLRVLFARVGTGFCPRCDAPITAQTREQIIGRILTLPAKTKFSVLAPVAKQQKGEHRDLFVDLLKRGFVRARVDGRIVELRDDLSLDRNLRHDIEVVVDRLVAGPNIRGRLGEAVDTALRVGNGALVVAPQRDQANDAPTEDGKKKKRTKVGAVAGDMALSSEFSCPACGISFEPPTPQLFSFNSPLGMCLECDGLGEYYSFDPDKLITDRSKSLKDGAIELVGKWRDLGRWKRHIFQGVADTLSRKRELPDDYLLETPWDELDKKWQDAWLWGTADEHMTFTYRSGRSSQKYGGKFAGIIPELLEKYRNSQSAMQIRQLEKYMRVMGCASCGGRRLNDQARGVRIATTSELFADRPSLSLPEVCDLPVSDAVRFFEGLELNPTQQMIAAEVLKEVRGRLGFLMNVGLDYLTLARTAPTLSGGESQRIRLAGQIGCGLVGVTYILDEPSIGLHPRDNDRLLATLEQLRDLGNTVVVVEHDEDTMRAADHLIDFGPGPGVRGGEVVAVGNADKIAATKRSVTGAFLSGTRKIAIPEQRRAGVVGANGEPLCLKIANARHNNLRGVDVEIPLGKFVCVTGVSGSGKSSLVNDILMESLRRDVMKGNGEPGAHDAILGVEHLDKVISIDQSPIGRTPRSNPATYIKVFDEIRKLYTQLPESKRRGYKPGRFSFNVTGGRCEACDGNGATKLEMDFLADIWVTCPVCEGHRFNRETRQVLYKGKSISEVLEMDIQQAVDHFQNVPSIHHRLMTLHDVGLDYLKLGQPSPTLSGGEAQRIKLARELVKKSTGKTLYLLDEPTTGLHFADIEMLLKVLHNFVDAGNTVLVVEHNLDVIKTADWLIDVGPEGGRGGGNIVAVGTPEQIAAYAERNEGPPSHTGRSLLPVIVGKPVASGASKMKKSPRVKPATDIVVRGARQHNLQGVDVTIPRESFTVCCGMSGSGKTSLAMDTIYAEGQRRYVESLSSYARQFVGQMQKPSVEHIEGLSPAIAIEQRSTGHSPRSTVGTVTEIYDYLRVLYARLGQPFCPDCQQPIGTQTSDQVVDKLLEEPEGTKLYLLAPLAVEVGEDYETLIESLVEQGYRRIRVDGQTYEVDQVPTVDRRRRHHVEIVIDRVTIRNQARARLAESVESALAVGKGVLIAAYASDDLPEPKWQTRTHSQHLACESCGRSFTQLSPHNFSFNSSLGWCPACEGLGTQVGANPAALIRDQQLTLAEGALLVWPDIAEPLSQAMLSALAKHSGIPTDVPLARLSARHRRTLLYGTGDDWLTVTAAPEVPAFRFQFKGLYPALDEASRLSVRMRTILEHLIDEIECSECGGSRLRDDASAMRFRDRTIDDVCRTPLGELLNDVEKWKLNVREKRIAGELVREVTSRIRFLVDVGLDYLTLARQAPTLSGGESQRIRLASQVGSGLCGVLYVLDEPTIGLHPRDNTRLIAALHKLRDLGNTLLVVEHDREVVESADSLLDFGPAAGRLGGQIVARGTPAEVARKRGSVTGPYLSGRKHLGIPSNRRLPNRSELVCEDRLKFPQGCVRVVGARQNNLKNITVDFPLGVLTAVTGVSGSGKSSLVEDILYASLARTLHRASTVPGAHDGLVGVERINKVIRVDQQPLGNNPSSNPATYTGVFDLIRQLYTQLPEAKLRGYTARQFSFNVPGGRCDACEGFGQRRVEMHFLPDVWITCDTCGGRRYNPDTLAVRYRGHSIADVLALSCREALELFENIPKIRRILQTLCDVGLEYLSLGQSAATLSGGEAQRVKLAAELARPDTGQTLYLLDEPTTGLHFDDLAKLMEVLHRLVDLGNTVVVIEHNLDVIKSADWIIDIGPEAGSGGGQLVGCGTPEDIVATLDSAPTRRRKSAAVLPLSHTAIALQPVLDAGPYVQRKMFDPAKLDAAKRGDLDLEQVGRDIKMPWEEDGRAWHTKDRVSRTGEPCEWDGKIVDEVEKRVQALGEFAPTNWNSRTIVEVTAEKKSDGWFLHMLTGERWLVKLKFRTAKRTFDRDQLTAALDLPPLDEMEDIPAYGRQDRVKCKNLQGPFQEVQIAVHSFDEVNRPAFWAFLEQAVEGFKKHTHRVEKNPEDLMPWKVLGQKWHLARKGFAPGKKVVWPVELLEELLELVSDTAPGGQFLWNNKVLVHYIPKDRSETWATVVTKRASNVELVLNGPKGAVQLGRLAELAAEQQVDNSADDRDRVRLRFRSLDDLARGDLKQFMSEHLDTVLGASVK
jgi:excinuclease ABC subunit A